VTARKKSTKPRSRRLPHGLEDETFLIKEAAAIAGLADKTAR